MSQGAYWWREGTEGLLEGGPLYAVKLAWNHNSDRIGNLRHWGKSTRDIELRVSRVWEPAEETEKGGEKIRDKLGGGKTKTKDETQLEAI